MALSTERRDSAAALDELARLHMQGYRTSDVQFTICLAHYLRGEFADCRRTLGQLARAEPSNERAAALVEVLVDTVRSEGRWGLVMLASGVAVAIGLGLWLWTRRSGSQAPFRGLGRGSHAAGGSPPTGSRSAVGSAVPRRAVDAGLDFSGRYRRGF